MEAAVVAGSFLTARQKPLQVAAPQSQAKLVGTRSEKNKTASTFPFSASHDAFRRRAARPSLSPSPWFLRHMWRFGRLWVVRPWKSARETSIALPPPGSNSGLKAVCKIKALFYSKSGTFRCLHWTVLGWSCNSSKVKVGFIVNSQMYETYKGWKLLLTSTHEVM